MTSSIEPTEIKVPYFLVALPQLNDPLFQKSVVLVASHDKDGAFGLIVNKSLIDEDEGSSAVMKAEIKDQDGKLLYEFNEVLFEGGPVHEDSVFVLHNKENTVAPTPELGREKIYVSSDPQIFQQLLGDQTSGLKYRFFLGCTSWTAGQLDGEIQSGSWVIVPFDKQFLFSKKPDFMTEQLALEASIEESRKWQEMLWRRVLLASGLDPLTLLAPSSGGGSAGLN
jgi:putative transcriptional regulator